MAAFNNIIVEAMCPSCGGFKTIECQTHVASDFNGDQTGRFCHRDYKLGEKMVWWPQSDTRYHNWREGNSVEPVADPRNDVECCYSKCLECKAELYAVIRFEETVPVELLEVGLEKDWPVGYLM
jgi:hypothetical protein